MADGVAARPFGIFSGRFDPPNLGHVITIGNLLLEYLQVVVVILDYPGREACSAVDAKSIFAHHFARLLAPVALNKIRLEINTEHFGLITRQQFDARLRDWGLRWEDCDYLSGNNDVLPNIGRMGMRARFVPRVDIDGAGALDDQIFSGTNVRATMGKFGMGLADYYDVRGL